MKRITFFTAIEPNAFVKHCRGAWAIIFVLLCMVVLADSTRAQSSPYAGSYSGEWIARATVFTVGERVHEGTWNISVASEGKVTGVEFDKTGGSKGSMSGFIDEDGYINVFVRYDSGTVTIKGVLEKKGTRLIGTLKQTCTDGSVCATIEIVLNNQSKPIGGITGITPTDTRAPANNLNCLPKQGTLIIKMKDGSKKIVDLSDAETVTVVP